MTAFLNHALIDAASIAIWNRNRAIIVIALATWGANLLGVIHGKSLFPSHWQTIEDLII